MPDLDPIRMGRMNGCTSETVLFKDNRKNEAALIISNANTGGSANGVSVVTNGDLGVFAKSSNKYGVGLVARGKGGGASCFGETGTGLYGESNDNHGVFGRTAAQAELLIQKIEGLPVAGSYRKRSSFAGVMGSSGEAAGVSGWSRESDGVRGYSESGVGVAGGVGNSKGFAGYFTGRVFAQSIMTGAGKYAAVAQPNGKHLLMYSMESPECWFEDFGSGRIVRGKGAVSIARDFAKVARLNQYQVFLTPEGDCRGLYVAGKTARGFTVRECQGGRSTLKFSYRIVAKRKDIPGPRMPSVDIPLIELPQSPPQPPKRPKEPKPVKARRDRRGR